MPAPRIEAAEIIASLLGFAGAQSIAPQDVASGVNGASLDRGATAANRSPLIAVYNFATASATTVFTPDLEESNNNSDFTSVAVGDLIGGLFTDVAVASDNAVQIRAYVGSARYVRAAIADDAGGTPEMLASAMLIQAVSLAHLKPYQIEQVIMDLNRRGWDQGSGEPPTNQSRLVDLIV